MAVTVTLKSRVYCASVSARQCRLSFRNLRAVAVFRHGGSRRCSSEPLLRFCVRCRGPPGLGSSPRRLSGESRGKDLHGALLNPVAMRSSGFGLTSNGFEQSAMIRTTNVSTCTLDSSRHWRVLYFGRHGRGTFVRTLRRKCLEPL